jgi:hypothetical protein
MAGLEPVRIFNTESDFGMAGAGSAAAGILP